MIYTIFMLLIAVFTFENVRTHDFWDGWDDRQLIEDAKQAHNDIGYMFSTEREMPIRPTVDSVFLLGYILWQDNPVAFRLFLIFMHLAASLMAVYTFRKMGIDMELCLISGLFFLVNVAHFRAVHWPTCISYTLGLIFALMVVVIYISRICRIASIWQIPASLALIAGIFAHPGIIVVVLFCAYWTYGQTQSVKQAIRQTIPLTCAAAGAVVLAVWVSPKSNQATLLTTFHDIPTLIQNFFWYLGRLFSSTFWLNKTTASYTKPAWEIMLGIVIGLLLLFIHRRSPHPVSIWPVWIILFVLVFINSEAYRLVFGPSRHLYFASVGSSIMIAWAIREIIFWKCASQITRQIVFAFSIISITITSLFFLRKAEAFAMYFAGRGHAYRIIEQSENLQTASRLFERAIRHAPHLVPDDIYIRLASMSFAMGEPCTDIFEEAGKRYPDNQTIAMLQGVALFLQSQEKHWQTGEIKIIQALEQASDPDDLKSDAALAFHNIGGYYLRQREYDKAARLFQKAIQYNPHHMTAYKNLGMVLNELGKVEESLAAYRQGLALRPGDVTLLQNLANALFKKGDAQAALPFFQELARLDATNSNTQFNLGMVLIANDEFSMAEQALQAAVHLNASDVEALQKLAEVQYALQKYPEALQSYQQLFALDPHNALFAYNLSALMLHADRIGEAVELLQRAIKIHPQDIELNLALAEAYRRQGDIRQARFLYERVLSLDSQNSEALKQLNIMQPETNRTFDFSR